MLLSWPYIHCLVDPIDPCQAPCHQESHLQACWDVPEGIFAQGAWWNPSEEEGHQEGWLLCPFWGQACFHHQDPGVSILHFGKSICQFNSFNFPLFISVSTKLPLRSGRFFSSSACDRSTMEFSLSWTRLPSTCWESANPTSPGATPTWRVWGSLCTSEVLARLMDSAFPSPPTTLLRTPWVSYLPQLGCALIQ